MEEHLAKPVECTDSQFTSDNLFNDCAVCKWCCRMIYEGVCGYHILQQLNSGKIVPEFKNKLVIFRVAEKDIDWIALQWVHYPKENLLRAMTHPKDGYYEFLMLPWLREGCPILTPTGCKYPNLKLFDCRLFPYYFQKGQLHSDDDCKYACHWNAEEGRKITQSLTDEYSQFCKTNQDSYFKELEKAKTTFKLPVYTIDETSKSVCAAWSWHHEPEKWK